MATTQNVNSANAPLTAAWNGTLPELAGSTLDLPIKSANMTDPGSVAVGISGTFVGTVQFEASADGVNYVAINGFTPSSATGASSATAPGVFQFNVAGLVAFRVRCSAFTSGTIQVQANVSTAPFSVQ